LVFTTTLVTSLFVTGISVQAIDTFLRAKIELKFPEIADQAGQQIDAWYTEQILNLGVLAASDVLTHNVGRMRLSARPDAQLSASRDVAEYLTFVRDRFAHFDSLLILLPDGEILISVGSVFDFSRDTRYQILATQDTPRPTLTSVGEQFVQIIPSRIEDEGGDTIGILAAVMPLHAVSDVIRSQRLGETGAIRLLDTKGHFVAVGRSRTRTGILSDPLPAAQQSEKITDYTDEAGDRVVGYAVPLSQYGLVLAVEERYDEAFAPLYSAFRRVLSINLAVVLLFGVVAFRIAVSIARPIEALSDAARRISEDEEDVAIPENHARDEVGVLTRTFSEMTARLASRNQALGRSQAETERAVQQTRERNDELLKANEVLEQLSITDGLTKLHNHRFFQEQLVRELKRTERLADPLALILIDIDHFKQWNDRLGHAGGDQILRKIAIIMNRVVRETDTLARYGGEEFALILPNTEMKGAIDTAEKIRSTVEESMIVVDLQDQDRPLTVSIGVNVYRGEAKALFTGADQALYRAKDGGRNRVMSAAEEPD
jgi:diguanylate cyclase (GGDEF)-like protein